MKEIKLRGKYAIGKYEYALVSDELYPFLNRFSWYAHKHREMIYAVTDICYDDKKLHFKMHRLIMNAPVGIVVDHEDGNTVNNQLSNLILKTKKGNSRNIHKSVFKGCYYDKRYKIWWCRIIVDGKAIPLGTYDDEVNCAIAYNHGAEVHFGDDISESAFNQIPDWRNITPVPHQKRRYIYKSNTSGVPGVSWNKRNNCWNVNIGLKSVGIEGKKRGVYVGSYRDRLEAIKARRDAEIKYLGTSDINLDDFKED